MPRHKIWIFDIDRTLFSQKKTGLVDFASALKKLKGAGKKTILISQKHRIDAEKALGLVDALQYFDALYTTEDMHDDYNSDGFWQEFIAANALKPEECIVLSDAESKAGELGFKTLLLNVDITFSDISIGKN